MTPVTPIAPITDRIFERLAVVGAGNMGSGIAQKMASEGFTVTLVDLDDQKVARGLSIIDKTLEDGVQRAIFKADEVAAIRGRLRGTSRFVDLADTDLVVEAVFEDLAIKKSVFQRLDEVCRPDAILATNTSSYSVTELAAATTRPERVVGLHYFYHPAKNRLVEVVAGKTTDPAAYRRAWRLQEALGKTPIASSDSYGFIVNRFFLPWLTEAVRMLEEGFASTATIDEGAKKAFGIGMGPFELMNVTGVPIAFHTATTLGRAFGPMYESPALLRAQVDAGAQWTIDGTPDAAAFAIVGDRLAAAACFVAGALVDEGVGTIEDVDIGARVGLRWRRGPFELMNHLGLARARDLVAAFAARWNVRVPASIENQARAGRPFHFTLVRSEVTDGIATLTINRPDAMNALNEAVFAQLEDRLPCRGRRSGSPGHRHRRERQGVRRRRRHPLFRPSHRGGNDRRNRRVHAARPGAPPRHRDVRQAGHRARAWHGARRRRRACPRVPRDCRHAEGVTGLSRNGHRNLSRPRRHAADAAPHRHWPRQVARALGPDAGS